MSTTPGAGAGVDRLVVVGASLAGLRAVEAARKAGHAGPITLIGAEQHLPYDRPPLSKAMLAPGATEQHTEFRTESVLRADLDVELVLGRPATALDADAHVVRVGEREIGFDVAVIATGSTPVALPGTDGLSGVHVLRGIEDALAIRAALDAGARTVVIGAGFIGSEIASSARARDLDVTIVEALDTPLVRAIGPQLGTACGALHTRNGTQLRCGVSVEALEGDGRVERVRLSDGSVLDADLVVVGIGARPATGWLEGSGVQVEDGVVCDEMLATSVPGVYAAGDVARWHNPTFDRPMRIQHWTSAAEQGARAVRNGLAPADAQPYATVPYFWSDWYGSRIQFVGVPSDGAVEIVSGGLDSDHFVALYREGDRLCAALTLNGQRHVMKYRNLITKGAGFDEALEFAGTLPARAPATA